jgi:predicted nucleic-acid-binding Zn-ribbon protein
LVRPVERIPFVHPVQEREHEATLLLLSVSRKRSGSNAQEEHQLLEVITRKRELHVAIVQVPIHTHMHNVAVQPDPRPIAECPKCKNREGIRDGGPSLSGHRAYDIYSDTYGLLRCPRCRFKGLYADFHQPKQGTK